MRITRILGSLALAASLTTAAFAGTPPATTVQQNKQTTTAKHVMAKHAKKHVARKHAAKGTATATKSAK